MIGSFTQNLASWQPHHHPCMVLVYHAMWSWKSLLMLTTVQELFFLD